MRSPFLSTVLVPVLETERLRLRGHRLDDFGASAEMWADAIVTRYIGGKPFTAEESWSRLLRYAGHWALLGFGYWVVEEIRTDRFIGEAGFADYMRNMEPSLQRMPEIGWAFTSQSHGKGFATEAVRAIVAWGDEHFQTSPTACIIHPENATSIRVAEKCGYRETAPATYKGHATRLFTR
jgi:RimJ/RimL family protein N-acetyltransferase